MSPARPKNLATNTVAWPCASAASIHRRHGRSTHSSLHPFRSTRHPLQLIVAVHAPRPQPLIQQNSSARARPRRPSSSFDHGDPGSEYVYRRRGPRGNKPWARVGSPHADQGVGRGYPWRRGLTKPRAGAARVLRSRLLG
jgi:hypothetical protein